MKVFRCQACDQILHFENTVCEKCSHRLGFLPLIATLTALEPEGEASKALAAPDVKQKLQAMGGDPRGTTPAEMKDLVSRQYETWKKLAVEANITIN